MILSYRLPVTVALRESLERQTRELGLADTVVFIGHIDDIPSFLADATFLVLTSDHEGFPNVVMEAMASGRAVVATDVGDVPFILSRTARLALWYLVETT